MGYTITVYSDYVMGGMITNSNPTMMGYMITVYSSDYI